MHPTIPVWHLRRLILGEENWMKCCMGMRRATSTAARPRVAVLFEWEELCDEELAEQRGVFAFVFFHEPLRDGLRNDDCPRCNYPILPSRSKVWGEPVVRIDIVCWGPRREVTHRVNVRKCAPQSGPHSGE